MSPSNRQCSAPLFLLCLDFTSHNIQRPRLCVGDYCAFQAQGRHSLSGICNGRRGVLSLKGLDRPGRYRGEYPAGFGFNNKFVSVEFLPQSPEPEHFQVVDRILQLSVRQGELTKCSRHRIDAQLQLFLSDSPPSTSYRTIRPLLMQIPVYLTEARAKEVRCRDLINRPAETAEIDCDAAAIDVEPPRSGHGGKCVVRGADQR